MASMSAVSSPSFQLDAFSQLQPTRVINSPDKGSSLQELSALDNIKDDSPRMDVGNVQTSIGRYLDVYA
ncbi:hypothetical protein ACFL54_08165 [Planctomycetota bacterium]